MDPVSSALTLASGVVRGIGAFGRSSNSNPPQRIPPKPVDSTPNPLFAFFQGSKNSMAISGINIFLILLFGFIFANSTISISGNSKSGIFIGYCIWGWIALISLALILRILHSLIGF